MEAASTDDMYCSAIAGYCTGGAGQCEACLCKPGMTYRYDTASCSDLRDGECDTYDETNLGHHQKSMKLLSIGCGGRRNWCGRLGCGGRRNRCRRIRCGAGGGGDGRNRHDSRLGVWWV